MKRSFKRRAAVFTTTATLAVASISEVAMAQPIRDSDGWRATLGVGVVSQPKYPGSDDTETKVLPILSGAYGRFTIGAVPGAGTPAGLGINLIQNEQWRVTLGLGGQLSKPREESDSPRLRGLGDIDGTALGSVAAIYTYDWILVRGLVVSDIGGEGQGTRASLDVEGKYRATESLTLSAGPGLVWADGRYTQKFFGIDTSQSANSGLAPYSAGSGLNLLRLTVGADYRLTQNWGLGAFATAGRLVGDAADSPITESKSQNQFGVFATYRF